jgi:hypothetical protein
MLRLNGAVFVQAHAVLAYGAFTLAFVTACSLHYTRIVKNEFCGSTCDGKAVSGLTSLDFAASAEFCRAGSGCL